MTYRLAIEQSPHSDKLVESDSLDTLVAYARRSGRRWFIEDTTTGVIWREKSQRDQ